MKDDEDKPEDGEAVVARLGTHVTSWAAEIRLRVAAATLIEKARVLAEKWRSDGAGVDAGALVDLVYAVEALLPAEGTSRAMAVEAAIALLQREGFSVTPPKS